MFPLALISIGHTVIAPVTSHEMEGIVGYNPYTIFPESA